MRVFVTGGTGFVGGAVVRHLLQNGFDVVALARPSADFRQLHGLPVNLIEGDLSTIGLMRKAMQGCDWVFHVAAVYAFWGYTWEQFYESNVQGTRNVLTAAMDAGIQRVVYTSSIAVLGPPRTGETADESTLTHYEDLVGSYKRSKFQAEGVAQEYARRGLPVVIVNPSAPVGRADWKPTATGKVIVAYLNGKMPAYVESHQNMVDVEDVAAGHLLAAQKGVVGERYILGGENMTLKRYLDILSEVSGLAPVSRRIPYHVALAWSYIDVLLAKLSAVFRPVLRPVLRKGYFPMATPDAVRIGKLHSYYDSSKAQRVLGYSPHSVKAALHTAVEWYRANGYAPKK